MEPDQRRLRTDVVDGEVEGQTLLQSCQEAAAEASLSDLRRRLEVREVSPRCGVLSVGMDAGGSIGGADILLLAEREGVLDFLREVFLGRVLVVEGRGSPLVVAARMRERLGERDDAQSEGAQVIEVPRVRCVGLRGRCHPVRDGECLSVFVRRGPARQ